MHLEVKRHPLNMLERVNHFVFDQTLQIQNVAKNYPLIMSEHQIRSLDLKIS